MLAALAALAPGGAGAAPPGAPPPAPGGGAAAGGEPGGAARRAWEPTGLVAPTRRLFAPVSGAFLAELQRSRDASGFAGLQRSDDAGATWRPLPLPLGARDVGLAAVDPADHDVLYVAGRLGVHKSADAGASWQHVLPSDLAPGPLGLAVSPADGGRVYLATGASGAPVGSFWRSRDGGTTWTEARRAVPTLCSFGLDLLQPHATDPERVYRNWGCWAGRNQLSGYAFAHSADGGATWEPVPVPAPRSTAGRYEASPTHLAGGGPAAPARWYLGQAHQGLLLGGGAFVLRSDDDGATWEEVLAAPDGLAPGGLASGDPSQASYGRVLGLVCDPAAPERVYVALSAGFSAGPPGRREAVRWSPDGGRTWQDAGRGQEALEGIHDLALGVDGRTLYAATGRGVWRLRLA
jgi:hypothetical protein